MRNQLRRAVKAKAGYGKILDSCMGRKIMGQHLGRRDPEVSKGSTEDFISYYGN